MKLNTKGFTAFEAVLIVLVIAALGFGGYTVYQNNKSESVPSETVTTVKPAQASDTPLDSEAQKWEKVTSTQGGFELRIPNGWSVTNFGQEDHIRASEITGTGTPAKIENVDGPYGGDGATFFSVKIFNNTDEYSYGEEGETETSFTLGSVSGKRFYKKYPMEQVNGPGPMPGQQSYRYEFNENNKQVVVLYNIYDSNEFTKDFITQDDPNQLELIERVIATLKIN